MTDYKELIDDIKFCYKNYVVVEGLIDVIKNSYGEFVFNKIDENNNCLYVIGQLEPNVFEEMNEMIIDVDKDGEYEISAIFKYDPPEFDNYGCTNRGGMVLEHMDITYIRSFLSRKRSNSLDDILGFGILGFDIFV